MNVCSDVRQVLAWGAVLGWALLLCMCASGAASAEGAGFGEEGSGAGQFDVASGVAVEQESGDVYIADQNNQRVDKFDGAGNFLLAWGWGVADGKTAVAQTCSTSCFAGLGGEGAGQFAPHSAQGIAVDSNPLTPSIYVIDSGNNRVEKFDTAGNFLLMLGREVNETAVNTPGATEEERDICTAVSGDVCKTGVPGSGPGQFERLNGHSIAVDEAGHVFVGDENRVQEFSPTGVVEGQIPIPGAGFIEELIVDSVDDLYIRGRELSPGIHKYDESGTELPGEPRDASGQPSSIALGPADRLFVSDAPHLPTLLHHMLEYDAAGAQLSSFDAGNEDGFRGIAYSKPLEALYLLNAGTVRVVNPPPPGPSAISQSTEGVEPTSATLKATVNPEGPEATTYHFEFGTTAAYGESTTAEKLEGGAFEDQSVSAAVTGLAPRTTYHFRVVVSNGSQTTDGPDQTFTTLPPVLIDGESATQVGSTSATLGAELNPLGRATEYHFEFGLDASYGQSAPVPDAGVGSGHTDVSVALQLQGLTPSTAYHYRVVAQNSLGVVEGEDRTFTTQGEAPSVLPDDRQWEMVSPPDKEGVSLEAIAKEGAVIQAAEDGSAITYAAKAAIEKESPSNRSLSNTQVLSRRSSTGWQSKDISTSHETVAIFRAGFLSEYRLFSEDLSSAMLEPQGTTRLSPQTSERTPYLRQNGEEGQFCLALSSCYRPLVSGCPPPGEPCPASVQEAANVPAGTEFGGIEESPGGGRFIEGVEPVGASPDTSRVVLASPQNLTAGYEGGGKRGLFEWLNGALRAVSVLPGGEAQSAELGGHSELNTREAVSREGDRVTFTAGIHLYTRDLTIGQTVQLDAVQGGIGGSGEVEYEGANRDQSKVFFTDDARLTSDATAIPNEPDLYECEVGVLGGKLSCALHDLTVDANAGQAADVQGAIAAFGENGRFVYFAANGVLAPGGVPGNCAEESESATCNLYMRDTVTEETQLVAELSGMDAPDWKGANGHGFLGELTARTSPDGRYLAFMSERPLTGYDNHDASSGRRDEEVFLYDSASETTRCVSCNPSGARPEGVFDVAKFPGLLVDRPRTWPNRWLAGSIPGWTLFNLNHALHQSRYLSDSGRMFFNSADALVPQDANRKEDVYEYEPDGVGGCTEASGCVSLISSGTSSEESTFMDASNDGSSAFFMTAAKLSEADVDSDFDIYDAHICTASSPCPPQATTAPPPCTTTDSCRAAPAPQPSIFGAPPSATFNGSANLTPPAKPVTRPKPPTRAQRLAKALKACAKKPKKKRAACRAQAQRRYGPRKAKKKTKKSANGSSSTAGSRRSLGDTAKGRGRS